MREQLLASAEVLASTCPPDLGREIAVLGSVAAGLADEHSDLELLFLVREPPPVVDVRRWLESAGAEDVLVWEESSDVAAWCRLGDVEVEPIWTPVAEVEAQIDAILALETVEHSQIALASVVRDALPLRDDGVLERLKARVAAYPRELGVLLVADAVRGWEVPSPRLGAAFRGDRVAVEDLLVQFARRILRILFAVNGRWEPPRWKWLDHHAAALTVAPEDTVRRMADGLLDPDAVAAVRQLHVLALDVLAIVPPDIEVSDARRGLERRLAAL